MVTEVSKPNLKLITTLGVNLEKNLEKVSTYLLDFFINN